MQHLIDFLPLIAFYLAYLVGGIYAATVALIGGCALQIGIQWWRTRTIKPIHGITALLAVVFGSATLLLHDPRFIQWKLSVLMWLVGAAFLVSQLFTSRPLAQRLLESALSGHLAPMNERRWTWINLSWVLFFAAVGALNLYVARTFSEQAWVNFKVYGVTGLMVIFTFAQVLWLPLRSPEAGDST
ncbi:MAG TPA: inner membrane-spanning protein YciB [Steroidobacteraceae bacterium]|nr:inner membrane-spanning protein YciB [Steroidobacteraceae bacterium]